MSYSLMQGPSCTAKHKSTYLKRKLVKVIGYSKSEYSLIYIVKQGVKTHYDFVHLNSLKQVLRRLD